MKTKNSYFLLPFITILFFFLSFSLRSQEIVDQPNIILKGIVVDGKGNPVLGANISVQGSLMGTITDAGGNFQLKIPRGAKIVISNIGYASLSFDAQGLTNIRVNIDKGTVESIITYCCINHNPSHCATTKEEMKKLSKEKNCTFK